MTNKNTLRDRLVARNGGRKEIALPLKVRASGQIDEDTLRGITDLARAAKTGDTGARDRLWLSMRARLYRKGWVLRPWPNTPHMTGIWDRGDVRQESWIVFVDLLNAWDGQADFVPYLLARFPWRLRDRVLRGIGKPLDRFGTIRIPEAMLAELLIGGEDEQPEPAVIARALLEALFQREREGKAQAGELDVWLGLINSRRTQALVSPDQILEEPASGGRSRVA